MSAYEQKRDDEYLNKLYCPFSEFIKRYNANLSPTHKTIFLFPGGMGSQLLRATTDFHQGPLFLYLPAWVDPFLPTGTAINLATQTPPNYDDYQQHFVVPYGCIDCPPFLRPYAGFINWCQSSNIDVFVFGWDWRRPSEAAAHFFLNRFLPAFDAYATAGGCSPHPLDNFWLIGHSFGGMVVKQILNQATNAYVQRMQRGITVGSPFYGYGGQVHRLFKGDELLNDTLNPNGARRVTEIVSSLPGGYELLFLPEATYDNNQAAFASDADGFNLMSYPSMDADNPAERADPYNPVPFPPATNPNGVRYISSCGFDTNLLAAGKTASDKVTQPLNATVRNKFYNIRGVGNNNTVVSQTWKRVLPTFDPDQDTDPVTDTLGPGDGTLPAWSTRLLGMNKGHVISIGGSIEHMDMMNEPAVQIEIAKLLQPPSMALKRMSLTARRNPIKIVAASRTELKKLLRQLAATRSKEDFSEEQRNAAVRKLLQKYSPEELQKFMARAYLDALKSPSQFSGKAKRARGKEPNRGVKLKRSKRKR
jgi:pimeloyl-ACP methyl ester carboxylesterase